jgi:hypothetical protein
MLLLNDDGLLFNLNSNSEQNNAREIELQTRYYQAFLNYRERGFFSNN